MYADVSDNAPSANPYIRAYAYDANGLLTHEGWAKPGTPTNAPKWAIRQYTNGTYGPVLSQWCDGNSAEDNVWDQHAFLTYA
jgi:hypothetical protein